MSSIAVVGRHTSGCGEQPSLIPEGEVDAQATDHFGYAEAKWVCEMVLQAANEMYGSGVNALLRGSSVRIGQMTGPEGSGCWNESEHFPIICRASQLVRALPDIGSVGRPHITRIVLDVDFSYRCSHGCR